MVFHPLFHSSTPPPLSASLLGCHTGTITGICLKLKLAERGWKSCTCGCVASNLLSLNIHVLGNNNTPSSKNSSSTRKVVTCVCIVYLMGYSYGWLSDVLEWCFPVFDMCCALKCRELLCLCRQFLAIHACQHTQLPNIEPIHWSSYISVSWVFPALL